MLNLKADPDKIDILKAARLSVSCDFWSKGLAPFLQAMIRKGRPVQEWSVLLPFWILSKVYEGLDSEGITILRYIPTKFFADSDLSVVAIHVDIEADYAGFVSTRPCEFCLGRGVVLGEVCKACGGYGKKIKENARCTNPVCQKELYAAPYQGDGWNKCPSCGGLVVLKNVFGTRSGS